jgi:hypothetical protein
VLVDEKKVVFEAMNAAESGSEPISLKNGWRDLARLEHELPSIAAQEDGEPAVRNVIENVGFDVGRLDGPGSKVAAAFRGIVATLEILYPSTAPKCTITSVSQSDYTEKLQAFARRNDHLAS